MLTGSFSMQPNNPSKQCQSSKKFHHPTVNVQGLRGAPSFPPTLEEGGSEVLRIDLSPLSVLTIDRQWSLRSYAVLLVVNVEDLLLRCRCLGHLVISSQEYLVTQGLWESNI